MILRELSTAQRKGFDRPLASSLSQSSSMPEESFLLYIHTIQRQPGQRLMELRRLLAQLSMSNYSQVYEAAASSGFLSASQTIGVG